MKNKKQKKHYRKMAKALSEVSSLLQLLNSRIDLINQMILSLHVAVSKPASKQMPTQVFTTPLKQRRKLPPEGVYFNDEEE
jgi:hypothetical protein